MFGVFLFAAVEEGAGLGLAGDILEAVAVEAGFEGGGAVEAPLGQGDVQDQFLFGFADGLEAADMILEEGEEFAGVFGFEEVLVGFGGAGDGVAAGGGLALRGAGAGRLLCVGTSSDNRRELEQTRANLE